MAGTKIFVAWVLTFGVVSMEAQDFNRDAWLGDFAALKQALEKNYSNLAWFGSPDSGVDLPALNRQTLAALKVAESDRDARRVLLSFVKGFGDGHFSQLAAVAPAGAAKGPRPDNPAYSRQDAAGGCAALGYTYDGPAEFTVPFESLPGFHLVTDGIGQPFRAGMLTAGNPAVRLGIVRIPVFEESHQSLCLEAWGKDAVWNGNGKFVRRALREAMAQSWYCKLAELLRGFKRDGAAAVLVDIGDNSGGGDSGDMAARLFTALPLHSASLWMVQDEKAATPYFEEQLDALKEALQFDPENAEVKRSIAAFTQQKEKLTQPACPMDWVWREQRPWKSDPCRRLVEAGSAGGPLAYLAPDAAAKLGVAALLHWPARVTPLWGTWTGPLFVLTNEKTYSAAEMFAALLQNNHAAKVVGVQTGGDGCGFMNTPEPLVLPNSHLRFRIPNCVRMRADGTDEVAGVRPDIPVLPTEGEGARVRAMRVFDEINADVKRSAAAK